MNGIDISNWQEGYNLKSHKIDFMIAKATEGLDFIDWTCDDFIQQAIKNHKLFGYYHFASGIDGKKEADFFWNKTLGYTGAGIPILDYERWGANDDIKFCEHFMKEYHKLSNVWPMLYISASHCQDFNDSWIPEKCGLWVAGYPYEMTNWPDGGCPYDCRPWKYCAIWQFTDNMFGGQIDGDVAYMDSNGWKKYAIGENLKGENVDISKAKIGTKSYEEVVREVMQGKWGNGWNREQALTGAGYDYELVQRMVNALAYAESVDYNGC